MNHGLACCGASRASVGYFNHSKWWSWSTPCLVIMWGAFRATQFLVTKRRNEHRKQPTRQDAIKTPAYPRHEDDLTLLPCTALREDGDDLGMKSNGPIPMAELEDFPPPEGTVHQRQVNERLWSFYSACSVLSIFPAEATVMCCSLHKQPPSVRRYLRACRFVC